MKADTVRFAYSTTPMYIDISTRNKLGTGSANRGEHFDLDVLFILDFNLVFFVCTSLICNEGWIKLFYNLRAVSGNRLAKTTHHRAVLSNHRARFSSYRAIIINRRACFRCWRAIFSGRRAVFISYGACFAQFQIFTYQICFDMLILCLLLDEKYATRYK